MAQLLSIDDMDRLLAAPAPGGAPGRLSVDDMDRMVSGSGNVPRETQRDQPVATSKEGPGMLRSFLAGVNHDGIAAALGLPVDAVTGVLNLALRQFDAPEIKDPVGGSTSMRRLMTTAGVENPDPVTPGERMARRVGQEVGSAAATAGLPFTGAAQRATGGVTRAIAEPARQAIQGGPGSLARYAAAEGAAALGAGAGAALAENQAPGNELASTAAQIAGGMAPGLVMAGGRAIGAAATGGTKDQIAAKAARRLQDATTDRGLAVQNIDDALQRADDIGHGYRPTTGQASSDPGLAGVERGVSRGPAQAMFTERKSAQNTALSEALDALDPTVPTPRRIEGPEPSTGAGRLVERLRAGAKAGAAAPEPDPGPAVRSGQVRSALDRQYQAFRNEARRLYDAVDPEDAVSVPTDRIRAWADQIKADQGTLGGSSQFPEQTVADVLATGDAVGFNQMRRFRERLNAEIRTAVRAGEGGKAEALGNLKAAVDGTFDDMMAAGQGEAVDRLRAANTYYRENAPRFKEGTAAKVLGVKGQGVDPERTAAAFIRPDEAGGGTGAVDLLRALKGERGTAQAYMRSDLAASAFDAQGNFSPARLRKHLADHPMAVAAFFGDPSNMRELATGRDARANMKRLVAVAQGDQGLMDQIKRGFWEQMQAKGKTSAEDFAGNKSFSPAGFQKFVRDNDDLLRVIYRDDPQHLEQIGRIRDALRDQARAETASKVGTGSDTAQNQGAKQLAGKGALLVLDVAVGAPVGHGARIARDAAQAMGLMLGRGEKVERLLIDAMLDPKLARDLLTRAESRRGTIAMERLRNYLAQAAGQRGRVEAIDQGTED